MSRRPTLLALSLCLSCGVGPSASADDSKNGDSVARAASLDAGRINNPKEKKLYEESIRSTKKSIARDTLDLFYRDAVEYYRDHNYDAALELLDRISNVDPNYENV